MVVTRLSDGHVHVRTGWSGPAPTEEPVVLAPGLVAVTVHDGEVTDEGFTDARSALLYREDAPRLLGAVAFGQWRTRVRFCSRCGAPLQPDPGGRVLRCEARHQEFPRIEPAVIMRVTDADDRVLLARQPSWDHGRFSVLAGFVDPGEALEDTVRREVMEEVGVHVGDVAYVKSQPWPFPSSLMLAFSAHATTTTVRLLDDEIAEAHWFSRQDLQAAMDAGDVAIPPPLSVAHQLIRAWMGTDLVVWHQGRPTRRL